MRGQRDPLSQGDCYLRRYFHAFTREQDLRAKPALIQLIESGHLIAHFYLGKIFEHEENWHAEAQYALGFSFHGLEDYPKTYR